MISRGKSCRAAAIKFGVNNGTLCRMFKFPSHQDYKGKGRRSKVLTEEEESFIAQRYCKAAGPIYIGLTHKHRAYYHNT